MFRLLMLIAAGVLAGGTARAQTCGAGGDWLQVLGSGGPEVDGRASSSYLIWHDGKARVVIDLGPGSALRFEQSGASLNDVQAMLFTHFHVDHSADLPALIKASYFSRRTRDLPVYGPSANRLMPSARQFIDGLFGEQGAYRYLNSYLSGDDDYRLRANDIDVSRRDVQTVLDQDGMKLSVVAVHHGPIPALAWRVDLGSTSVVVSGDMNGDYHTLEKLADHADWLVAHHAIPEHSNPVARALHMPPSVIGDIAARAQVKHLVLSHRMQRTLGHETEAEAVIRRDYTGTLSFAEDLQCYPL